MRGGVELRRVSQWHGQRHWGYLLHHPLYLLPLLRPSSRCPLLGSPLLQLFGDFGLNLFPFILVFDLGLLFRLESIVWIEHLVSLLLLIGLPFVACFHVGGQRLPFCRDELGYITCSTSLIFLGAIRAKDDKCVAGTRDIVSALQPGGHSGRRGHGRHHRRVEAYYLCPWGRHGGGSGAGMENVLSVRH